MLENAPPNSPSNVLCWEMHPQTHQVMFYAGKCTPNSPGNVICWEMHFYAQTLNFLTFDISQNNIGWRDAFFSIVWNFLGAFDSFTSLELLLRIPPPKITYLTLQFR